MKIEMIARPNVFKCTRVLDGPYDSSQGTLSWSWGFSLPVYHHFNPWIIVYHVPHAPPPLPYKGHYE